MTSRRGFLAGLLATGLAPVPVWADVGAPKYLTAAKLLNGQFRLFGLSDRGLSLFDIALPGRGHAAAAHPIRAEAVAFARRPGTFAVILDCTTGRDIARLTAPAGRHFYGHGAFTANGDWLLTTENDIESGEGRLGIWDTTQSYRRVSDISSGGIGPHDIALLPDGETFVIANGGIETHPDSGRAKLNIPTMLPNLTCLNANGVVLDQVTLGRMLHKNSIRHLDVRSDGLISFAMQYQAEDQYPPLIGLYRPNNGVRLLEAPGEFARGSDNYAAGAAFSRDGTQVGYASPRGGIVHRFHVDTGAFIDQISAVDVSGLVAGGRGFLATTGQGSVLDIGSDVQIRHQADVAWDNHLVAI
ncbi:MAG: DUF1513 domain-containing protein [Pseudoruegeria sp.]